MKYLIFLLFPLSLFSQKKVEVVNLNDLVDTATQKVKIGSHEMVLKFTNGKIVFYDTLNVSVYDQEIAVNHMPLAYAGRDSSVSVGKTATVSGVGFDTDGQIVGYYWKKISGPRYGKISWSNRQTTTLTNLVAGTYTYRLTVTDNNGGTNYDDVILTVK
jgi:hypothetical protein